MMIFYFRYIIIQIEVRAINCRMYIMIFIILDEYICRCIRDVVDVLQLKFLGIIRNKTYILISCLYRNTCISYVLEIIIVLGSTNTMRY